MAKAGARNAYPSVRSWILRETRRRSPGIGRGEPLAPAAPDGSPAPAPFAPVVADDSPAGVPFARTSPACVLTAVLVWRAYHPEPRRRPATRTLTRSIVKNGPIIKGAGLTKRKH